MTSMGMAMAMRIRSAAGSKFDFYSLGSFKYMKTPYLKPYKEVACWYKVYTGPYHVKEVCRKLQ
jgi:hypothetical protein